MLQDIMWKYNEVHGMVKKLGVEHRSHRDGRARRPDWPDFTVHAQWQRAPRISRRSCSRTSRSATMYRG